MKVEQRSYVRAARLVDVEQSGCRVVTLNGNTVALVAHEGAVYAVDNRCPHMGFPLHRGTVRDGILTCHWHHARFDLATGGTFDPFADDVRTFPVEVRDGDVYVDTSPRGDLRPHFRKRLREGLEDSISLVVAKSVLYLDDASEDPAEAFRIGLDFGVTNRAMGWGQGLTMHTCFVNLLPHLHPEDRPRALFHGLSAVAAETQGAPPNFVVRPLPGASADLDTLKRWFRRFVEVRDDEGAERCLVTAVDQGATSAEIAGILFAAATDHRYITIGHVADFSNKALEALDVVGLRHAASVMSSLAGQFAGASRMEESVAWRHPVDLVSILSGAFERIPESLAAGGVRRGSGPGPSELTPVLLGEDPQAIADALLDALERGCSEADLACAVTYAAARRIAHFHISNEFSDWDTALHTFSFASAIEQACRRAPSAEVLRGVFDAAMSVYLDRFLNIPSTPLPAGEANGDPDHVLAELPGLLDRQQQVNQAASLVATYLASGGEPSRLIALLGKLLLREDRDFHTIQTVEAAVRLYGHLAPSPEAGHALVAAVRYLAAHSPTVRRQGQTYQIAARLHRGEKIYED